MHHCWKHRLMNRLKHLHGIWFHLIGLACLLWFCIRVLPAPHRAKYPCQQISLGVALTYIGFWAALFSGVTLWLKKVKHNSKHLVTSLGAICLIIGLITTGVFAGNQSFILNAEWTPIPNEPLGTPRGVQPGRVVWVWDPDATQTDLQGYWWNRENTDLDVVESMMSQGIQSLAGVDTEAAAWDALFTHFNQLHGKGNISYQQGENIAIKINLNNCWDWCFDPYTAKDNQRDAHPQVVKALLHKLIDVVGVNQEDITVYDASRKMGNWFYRQVYYEAFPALRLVPEFPDVHFVDSTGGMPGREQVVASNERIYFADGTDLYRTLPTCVVDADYLINMPILKRHPIQQGVTLSGKNYFGTFIEDVADLHPYHEAAFIPGNPAPQVDLLAHEQVGGKTLLYLADGLFATKIDHRTIEKFQMYPFNDDWTNSLFFSQDPVALDSVMYDFLYEEDTKPVEGSQQYLHQAAEPPADTYDPENDGVFLSESLGVHEHGNFSTDIFSSDRYVGPSGNGIEYIALGEEHAHPAVVLTRPKVNTLYIANEPRRNLTFFSHSLVIGPLTVTSVINGVDIVDEVGFYLEDDLQHTDDTPPYEWTWETKGWFRGLIRVEADTSEGLLFDELFLWKLW